MDARTAAEALGGPVNDVGGRFMLDPATFVRGMEVGFAGLDFYVRGRGGALGDVPGDVVAAAFVFLEPTGVAKEWESGTAVMPADRAADHFMACGHTWGRDHLPADLPGTRLGELARAVTDAADVAGLCLFAAWRLRPWPEADDGAAYALHGLNLLRELRGGAHGMAVRSAGLHPHEAVRVRGGIGVCEMLGWQAPHPDKAPLEAAWDRAEEATNRQMAAALEVLKPARRAELAELAAHAATAG